MSIFVVVMRLIANNFGTLQTSTCAKIIGRLGYLFLIHLGQIKISKLIRIDEYQTKHREMAAENCFRVDEFLRFFKMAENSAQPGLV